MVQSTLDRLTEAAIAIIADEDAEADRGDSASFRAASIVVEAFDLHLYHRIIDIS
jgi:hypothetical protein